MTVNELSSRLEILERENRRMKWGGFAVAGVLLAVVLIGAAKPTEIPQVIESRAFRVIDENGKVRAQMSANFIGYFDENEKPRAQMSANGIGYFDENGKPRAQMSANGTGYFDENGRDRAQMGDAGMAFLDAEGKAIWMAPQ